MILKLGSECLSSQWKLEECGLVWTSRGLFPPHLQMQTLPCRRSERVTPQFSSASRVASQSTAALLRPALRPGVRALGVFTAA